ncbi:DNA repair protein RadA [Candidatus Falkowbacteria bacterium CG10_big_fil_rev_8_21_14_0_10_39_11]|uniref:DNA repair protein RadA n=1 Tax=Candidatus Falkowbacteria bacterium CG10_big_fil_rev_8_21_14_0_10_39_11 TaxID=1974565 RepID=A0A2H0V837_9BACT|nr:MAG: DNA repair protein RadA [Candidatus Falkowbacteria bacterium CG10_big_fil_rev_8_21_14_0_10_39_11]
MKNQLKIIYSCSKCDAQFPKWSGRCTVCGAWSTIKEEVADSKKSVSPVKFNADELQNFSNVADEQVQRRKTTINELDQVLGGGIVPGSLILLGGEPGIGKSTIALQIFQSFEQFKQPTLYVSGEESAGQVKLRADRLGFKPQMMKFLGETQCEKIIAAISELKPSLAIIDSIQTIHSAEADGEAGNITQIRAVTVKLLEAAKKLGTPVILTGHVTKDGVVAGPKTLEHLVDVVLYLEGDKYHGYRILRTVKNRFGSTNEIGIFAMTDKGLQEVANPSKIFIEENKQNLSGSVVSCLIEGSRAFLLEVQALVSVTPFGYPQRKTAGYDGNRLQMLAAVINKRTNLNLTNQDIHLNIVGGIKTKDPALDLAVVSAIISSYKNIAVSKDTIILGEVGLGGEVRPVYNLEKRIKEAQKLGFTKAIVPKTKDLNVPSMQLSQIETISQLPLLG